MTVELRLVRGMDPDPAMREIEAQLAGALAATAPRGCAVGAIAPADAEDVPAEERSGSSRRTLEAAWRAGVTGGAGKGLVHSASLLAPLVRHDRVHDGDQTVVTLWGLSPSERSGTGDRAAKAFLRRAERFADAVVLPAHALVAVLERHAPRLVPRVRVIAGAPPAGYAVPTDAVGRRRALGVPEGAVVVAAAGATDAELEGALAAARGAASDVAVLDVGEARAEAVRLLGAGAGFAPEHVHVLGAAEPFDRAALLGSAPLLIAPSTAPAFPWRAVEALAVGTPVVAAASRIHDEVLLDGALLAGDDPTDAVRRVLDPAERERWAVRAADRGRTFAWRDHAERVWALHAEL